MPKKDNTHYFGYHLSVSGGMLKQIKNASEHEYKPNAFQVFTQSPKCFTTKNIDAKSAQKMKDHLEKNSTYLVVHAPFILNMAKNEIPDPKVFNCAISNVQNAHDIGASGAIFHVGKKLDMKIDDALKNMENFVRQTIKEIRKKELKAYFILETGAGQGSEMCCDIKDLGAFYKKFSDEEKEYFRLCVDTCHVFAAGYNLKTKQNVNEFIELWENHIGWKWVEVIHLNDSKKDCNCKVDRHEDLKKGCIWKETDGLEHFVSEMKKRNIPLVLETLGLEGEDLTKQLKMIKD
jgi:apurinic endonuclease APN1